MPMFIIHEPSPPLSLPGRFSGCACDDLYGFWLSHDLTWSATASASRIHFLIAAFGLQWALLMQGWFSLSGPGWWPYQDRNWEVGFTPHTPLEWMWMNEWMNGWWIMSWRMNVNEWMWMNEWMNVNECEWMNACDSSININLIIN